MKISGLSPDKKRLTALIKVVCGTVFWIFLWYIIAARVQREVLLPSPLTVLKRLIELSGEEYFFLSVASTLGRILSGWLCGVAAGVLVGALCHISHIADALFSPIIKIIKCTPVASFILLALVWADKATIPALIAVLMVMPVVYSNIRAGLSSLDKGLSEAASVFSLSFTKRLRCFYIPSLFPYFTSSSLTSLGLAWKAGVAAEVLCRPENTIGKYLYESKLYIETPDLFAWTLTVIILSVILEAILKAVLSVAEKKK